MSSPNWQQAAISRQKELKNKGLWRERRVIGSAQQPLIQSNQQWLTNFSSNDYLGLASHPKLGDAADKASAHWGNGAGASHLICGHQAPHHQLEAELADFVGAERALLFANGYMANLALNTALLQKSDLLLHDRLNHASLIDGAQLSLAKYKRYAHLDLSHAKKIIQATEFQRLMLVSDSVFSMDGDLAPLVELKSLSDQHGGLLCVDDAHGFGVLGLGGRGALSEHGLVPSGNVVMMGTLSKAFGSYGAFVAGDEWFVEHLVQSARSYIYTTALPSGVVAASRQALNIIRYEHQAFTDQLTKLIALFKQGCELSGISLIESNTPIQPVNVGDEQLAVAISRHLEELGFLVPAIRTPTVPKGQARLRVTLTAAHTDFQVQALVDALGKALSLAVKQQNGAYLVVRDGDQADTGQSDVSLSA